MGITAARRLVVTPTGTLLAAALFLLVLAASATGAVAATNGGGGLSCQGKSERPFLPWLDPAQYTLAPGGDFERDGGWQLKSGARLVNGNESFQVHGKGDRRSLALPAGSSALSPSICVGLGDPTVRLFVSGGRPGSLLKLEALVPTAAGTLTQPVGVFVPGREWSPGIPLALLGNITGLTALRGTTTTLRLRLTVLGAGEFRVDDVYVDPWKIH
jgi:hypothetical protein